LTIEASGSSAVDEQRAAALRASARRHLWRHFAPVGADEDVPIFVRGEGCYGVLLISDDTICSWGRLGTCSAPSASTMSPT